MKRKTEPGTVIAVNESDEAKATGGTLDCPAVICSNWKQMNPTSGLIGQIEQVGWLIGCLQNVTLQIS